MNMRTLHRTALTVLLAMNAIAASSETRSTHHASQFDVRLRIESTCAIERPAVPVDLGQARHVAVRCAVQTQPYAIDIAAQSASGEPMSLQTIAGQIHDKHASHDADAETYLPIVTVTVAF